MADASALALADPANFVLREAFGLGDVAAPLRRDLARLVKAIACADRDLSETESNALLALARAYGLTREETEELVKWDAMGQPVEPLATPETMRYARLVLHDALRVAGSDGVAERERKAAALAMRALGVDPQVVVPVRGLLVADEALRAWRIAMVHGRWPDEDPFDVRLVVDDAEAYRRQEYGLRGALPAAEALALARAVVAVVGADGELSAREWAWLLGWARALGLDAPALAQLVDWPPAREAATPLADAPAEHARLALYAAVRTARADGLVPLERAAAERMAERLKVAPTAVPALEGLLAMEDALRVARLRVLSAHATDAPPRGTF